MTRATPRERAAPRFYMVDRSATFQRPSGYDYCGPMVRRIVGRDEGGFTLSLDLWERPIADNTVAVVLVTATLLDFSPTGHLALMDWRQITVQRPRLIHLWPGDSAHLTAHQERTGEVLVWPLTVWGPPKPPPCGLDASSLSEGDR